MPEENKNGSAIAPENEANKAGSPDNLIQKEADPNLGGETGESAATTPPKDEKSKEDDKEEMVPISQYENLEEKLGEQGNELGEYRDFYEKISPFLDKVDEQPDLVKAIMANKITPELVESVLKGKVSTKEAETVTEAHKKVKEQLGKKEYDKTSPEDIENMVSEKVKEGVSEAKKEFDKGLNSVKEDAESDKFERQLTAFIEKTPDYADYAEDIQKWFGKNPTQYDIKIAYDVVKGQVLADKVAKDATEADGEAGKDIAGNAAGGGSQTAGVIEDKKLVDELIADKANPNVF